MKIRINIYFLLGLLIFMLVLTGWGEDSVEKVGIADASSQTTVNDKAEEEKSANTYKQISQEEAKRLIDEEDDYIILDVREQEEYDEKHIPGAVLMPYTKAEELASEILPDKDQMILIYCRSGRRSKIAAQTLADMGYTNIYEFGGIIDWPYETE